MELYIYIDDDLTPKSLKAGGDLIDFDEDSVGLAMQLVLSQTSVVEKGKIYGPFDVPTYVREKDGLY